MALIETILLGISIAGLTAGCLWFGLKAVEIQFFDEDSDDEPEHLHHFTLNGAYNEYRAKAAAQSSILPEEGYITRVQQKHEVECRYCGKTATKWIGIDTNTGSGREVTQW